MIRRKETSRDYKDLTENAIFWQIMEDLDELKDVWASEKTTKKDLIKIAKTLNNLLLEVKG